MKKLILFPVIMPLGPGREAFIPKTQRNHEDVFLGYENNNKEEPIRMETKQKIVFSSIAIWLLFLTSLWIIPIVLAGLSIGRNQKEIGDTRSIAGKIFTLFYFMAFPSELF